MKIIVDTNIVFSSILNPSSNIGKILILRKEQFQLDICEYLRIEIKKHHNHLLNLSKLSEEKLNELLKILYSKVH